MDYDEELHVAWVDAAMVKAYDFAEAYCDHLCDDEDRLHELNTARRALREHLMNRPASMSLTDPELRARIELQRREIDRLREAVAAEREACALVCEAIPATCTWMDYDEDCMECARAIRARGDA